MMLEFDVHTASHFISGQIVYGERSIVWRHGHSNAGAISRADTVNLKGGEE